MEWSLGRGGRIDSFSFILEESRRVTLISKLSDAREDGHTFSCCPICFVVDSLVKKKEDQSANVHQFNTKRPEFAAFSHVFPDLNNPDKFYSFFRMTTEHFKKLIDITGMSIKILETNYRRFIGVEERITISYRAR